MKYVIQENVFRERHYDKLKDSLIKLDLEFDTIRCFPFVDKIVNIKDIPNEEGNYTVDELPDYTIDDDKVFCFGAIKLARVASNLNWFPGSMMNDNHDYMVYKDHWKEHLLNYDSKICKLTEDLEWNNDEIKFIRPTQDTKSFTGQTFNETEWNDMVENYLHNYRSNVFNEDTLIQVSSVKNINKEIRFWVVGGKVVTGSTYRVLNQFNINGNIYKEEYEYAQKMVDIFQLNTCFVIDICVTDNNVFKIVEAGCLNAAGFYNADLCKVIMALEELYS